MDYRKILIRPLFTEKMSFLEETERKYAFQVDPSANKIQIKQAVEALFDVKVQKVNVINGVAKPKRVGQYTGFTSKVTKAIVTLQPGNKIDIYEV